MLGHTSYLVEVHDGCIFIRTFKLSQFIKFTNYAINLCFFLSCTDAGKVRAAVTRAIEFHLIVYKNPSIVEICERFESSLLTDSDDQKLFTLFI